MRERRWEIGLEERLQGLLAQAVQFAVLQYSIFDWRSGERRVAAGAEVRIAMVARRMRKITSSVNVNEVVREGVQGYSSELWVGARMKGRARKGSG